MTSITMDNQAVETGAWYTAKDYNEIRRVFGYKAAEYLRIPRRAGAVVIDLKGEKLIQFQTMGDQSQAIGMDGHETNFPRWPIKWLRKVKDASKIDGKQYRVLSSWKTEANRRKGMPYSKIHNYLHPEFAGKIVTASHESFSGVSVWCRLTYSSKSGMMACIPRAYLEEIPEKVDQVKVEKVDQVKVDQVEYANGRIVFKVPSAKSMKQDLIDLGIFPEDKHDAAYDLPLEKMTEEDLKGLPVKGPFKDEHNAKESTVSSSKVSILDEKVRMLESRLREVEEGPVEDFEDLDNDLDHSMVLDLPPNIAEWAKEAGIGLEDMIPLAKEICELQSNMTLGIQEEYYETERHVAFQEAETQSRLQETEQAKAKASLAQAVSSFRHETFQVFIRWAAGAGTISYLAHQASGLFL